MRERIVKYILGNQVLVAILVVATVWLMVEIREILITLFVAYILMAAISPFADQLERKGIPRTLAVIAPYIVTIAALIVLILSLAPFLASQVALLITKFPAYLNQEIRILELKLDAGQINSFAASELNNIGKSAFSLTSAIFGSIFAFVSIFAISFYLLLYRNQVRDGFVSLFTKRHQAKVRKTTFLIEEKLGSWLRGQIVLSFVIGLMTYIALLILGIEFALPLAVIAGVLELVPTIGPILSAIPALIVAFNISVTMAVVVLVLYMIIQFVENHVVVPRVMQRAVGLNPIIIILAIITGGKLLGIPGALLAIPFISLLVVVYKNLD